MNPKMESMKALEQLENMKLRDAADIERNRKKIIADITRADKTKVRNTIMSEPKKEKLGFLWRLKKVLGMQ